MAIGNVPVRVSINGGEANRLEESYVTAELAEYAENKRILAERKAVRAYRASTPAHESAADRFRRIQSGAAAEFGAALESR